MNLSKMKIASAAVCVLALVGSVALARTVHNQKISSATEQAFGPNAVFGPDGKFIGVAPDANTRAEMKTLLDLN